MKHEVKKCSECKEKFTVNYDIKNLCKSCMEMKYSIGLLRLKMLTIVVRFPKKPCYFLANKRVSREDGLKVMARRMLKYGKDELLESINVRLVDSEKYKEMNKQLALP